MDRILPLNCYARFYAFNGNTTAFVQMEDGVNEYGLAIGLTFIYPHIRKPGLNAGMLLRYVLEKCKTTKEAIHVLRQLPIASAQTLTIADSIGDLAVVECNPEKFSVIYPKDGTQYVATANNFNSEELKEYVTPEGIDDWNSSKRYETARNALDNSKEQYSLEFAQDLLGGKYGFMCQYDRKTGADTVWSVVYDLKNRRVYRVEGNPSRKKFIEDTRMKFSIES